MSRIETAGGGSSFSGMPTTPQTRTDQIDLTDIGNDYRSALLDNVLPFWLRHGLDREHGGMLTCLDEDGSLLDTDKSIWFQGRAAWMFATVYNTVEPRAEWLEAARSCVEFLHRHAFDESGKMYFSVTREGLPLRMRRYVFSESFASIAFAAFFKATGDSQFRESALTTFGQYLHHSFTPGVMPPKVDSRQRPMMGLAPLMIGIVTAQELRTCLGDVEIRGRTCSGWIRHFIETIERNFLKTEFEALLETVGPGGEFMDHFDGRLLNPGHAIECAWFILHEAKLQSSEPWKKLGLKILDWMWKWGWDETHGGLFYFRDVRGKPVAEYWHDMKFWWPHNEAMIATLLAYRMTGDPRYAQWHLDVSRWSFSRFSDPRHGEWFGYLHRDGSVSSRLKGNLYKGPFHLPRSLLICWKLCCQEPSA